MKKSTVTKEAQAEIDAENPTSQIWIVRLIIWVMDALSAVAVLALAVMGAKSLIMAELNGEIKVGIAVLVVGLLAARILERAFQTRR